MKELFRGRYRPTQEEFQALWEHGAISVDANVLLATYEFSNKARKDLFGLFRVVRERLWVPYQFAEEFQTSRIKVIADQLSSYSTARTTLEGLLNDKLKTKNKHPFVSKTSLLAIEKICEELKKGEVNHRRLFSSDPHHNELSEIFDGRIGTPPTVEEFNSALETARVRRDNKIPPGFRDSKKPEPACFGDYFGWREILAFGAEHKVPMIFITDEKKPDWWHIHGSDNRIGPRHELIEEYYRASGQHFYIYQLAEFMRHSKKYLQQTISASTLQEVEERTFEEFTSDDFFREMQNAGFKPDTSPLTSGAKRITWDQKGTEQKASEPKASEPKAAEPKATGPKTQSEKPKGDL